jgi:hypothetical protein
VAIILTGLLALSATGTVYGNEGLPQLTSAWWQWFFSIPSSVHPLTLKAADPTGTGHCMVGQHGDVWFLGGVFKIVDVSSAMRQANAASRAAAIVPIVVERACTLPLGKAVLIPVLNGECNTAEELALGNTVPEDLADRARFLRKCAKTLGDAVTRDTASAQFGPVTGGVWAPKSVNVKRVHTSLPFSVTFGPDNIFSTDCSGGPNPFLCEPDPNPSLAHADGYWATVQPKAPGTYKLETFGEAPDFAFALKVIYTLTVVGPSDQ